MSRQTRHLGRRLAPAALTSTGVTLLAAGLLAFGGPVVARPGPSGPGSSDIARASGPPATPFLPTLPPIDASVGPSVAPSVGPSDRLATRVVIEGLGIDLPIIIQPDPDYPACNVAMYLEIPGLGQPGSNRSIYLYAHARTGMFLPLLTEARRNGGKAMIGLPVSVFTSDDQEYVYAITKVLPRVPPDSHFLDRPLAVTSETLWLQTSTGPNSTYPKLQVVAEPWAVLPADHEAAHPRPHPVNCH